MSGETILEACKYLAQINGFFTLTALSIKLDIPEDVLINKLTKLKQVVVIEKVIFMKDFSEYCDLGTFDLCVLSLLHHAADPDNIRARARLIHTIKIIRHDLNDYLTN